MYSIIASHLSACYYLSFIFERCDLFSNIWISQEDLIQYQFLPLLLWPKTLNKPVPWARHYSQQRLFSLPWLHAAGKEIFTQAILFTYYMEIIDWNISPVNSVCVFRLLMFCTLLNCLLCFCLCLSHNGIGKECWRIVLDNLMLFTDNCGSIF